MVIKTENEADYDNKGVPSIKESILSCIRKITDITSNELTGSYTQQKPVKIGGGMIMMETYHPDLRLSYCELIETMTYLIYPYTEDWNFRKVVQIESDKDTIIFDELDTKKKLKICKRIFKEINQFFHDSDFFESTSSITVRAKK